MEAAATAYFGIAATDLTVAQASILAALPNAPTALNPYTGWDALKERQAERNLQSTKVPLKLNPGEIFDIGLKIITAPPC